MTSFAENPESADRASKPLALQGRARVGDIWAAGYQPTGIGAVERFQAGPGIAACIDPQSVSQAAAARTASPGETPCVVGAAARVKASGEIRTLADAKAMRADGANRLGTGSGVATVQQALQGRPAW
jgi:hypothetical protein